MKLLSFFVASIIATSAFSQEETEKTSSAIEEVTVFLSGAQIHRSAKVKLNKGNNLIRLSDLSRHLVPNSIQVKGQQGLTIASVSHQINYLNDASEPSHIKVMRMELGSFVDRYQIELNESEVLQAEKELILANGEIGGSTTGVDAIELLDIADYYRTRLNEIDFQLLEKEKRKKDINKKIVEYRKQLNEFGYKANQPVGEILLKISSDRARQANINFSYMVKGAGWTPLYDVRSNDVTGPIELTYKGNVYQNTGQDWKDVKLNLSTGNPSVSGDKPEFYTWHLNAYSNGNNGRKGRGKEASAYSGYADFDSYESGASSADFTSTNSSGINAEFNISIPYTIPSDGKFLAVEIQKHQLKAQYNYLAVPKLDPDAFLIAGISGWGDLSLLSGEAYVYYQGTYVGNSYIDAETPSDTLNISLGRDNNVFVQRKKIKDYCSNATIGSNKKTEVGIEISLKNTKTTPITIELQDQIPVSSNKEIEVSINEISGAKLDEDSGQLTWKLQLAPDERKSVIIKYSVKRPKNTYIPNL